MEGSGGGGRKKKKNMKKVKERKKISCAIYLVIYSKYKILSKPFERKKE